jgi:hypothetical protein
VALEGILPDGASADLWEFFKAHPNSNIDEAIAGLELPRSTAFYALSHLFELKLIEQASRRRKGQTRRWKVVEHSVPPVVVVPAIALTIASPGMLQPTGTPYAVVDGKICPLRGAVEILFVSGARLDGPNYSREGTVNAPPAGHPWAYSTKARA